MNDSDRAKHMERCAGIAVQAALRQEAKGEKLTPELLDRMVAAAQREASAIGSTMPDIVLRVCFWLIAPDNVLIDVGAWPKFVERLITVESRGQPCSDARCLVHKLTPEQALGFDHSGA